MVCNGIAHTDLVGDLLQVQLFCGQGCDEHCASLSGGRGTSQHAAIGPLLTIESILAGEMTRITPAFFVDPGRGGRTWSPWHRRFSKGMP